MNDGNSTKGARISEALRMGQEPKDRLWAVIYVLIVIVLLVGAITVIYAESTRNFLETGRSLGFERGAVDCLTIVVDNDRDFALPQYCQRAEVVVYYPPEVCDTYLPDLPVCGEGWEEG
jgi:hypothetical protein